MRQSMHMSASTLNRSLYRLGYAVVFIVAMTAVCAAQQPVEQVVQSANKFLATLSDAQRSKVLYDFNDHEQRARWSNFPTGFVPRGGMSLKQMSPTQRAAALDLMKIVLSARGYEKVSQIRMADDDFKTNGSKRGPGGAGPRPGGPPPNGNGGPPQNGPGGPGGPPRGSGGPPRLDSDNMFGADLYYISFLGKPSTVAPWMLQFGGHHLALNITIAGSHGIMTPSLTGAQPAVFKVDGKTIRPLGRESDEALALLQSLDAKQRSQAVLNYKVADLVLGPGTGWQTNQPRGTPSLRDDRQAEGHAAAAHRRVGRHHERRHGGHSHGSAQVRTERPVGSHGAAQPIFRWEPTSNAYYRIQGPHLVIEYAPQSDEPTNHVHTIYRDPTNDYGEAVVGK